MKSNPKFELHQRISNLEERLEVLPRDCPQWTILAHARKEWCYGNYIQVERDLKRLDQLTFYLVYGYLSQK